MRRPEPGTMHSVPSPNRPDEHTLVIHIARAIARPDVSTIHFGLTACEVAIGAVCIEEPLILLQFRGFNCPNKTGWRYSISAPNNFPTQIICRMHVAEDRQCSIYIL